ncbi:hypothetical protein V2J09_002159 [Rumex salicifolius]
MDLHNPTTKAFPFFVFVLLLLVNGTFEQGAETQQPLASYFERLALLQLRSALGLRARDWPVKADPCLIWRGISCQNGAVVGINISGFRRTRIGSRNPQFAVESLANLTRLESFNASSFALPGQIPDWFGQSMENLRVLDLSFCSISGAIPWSLGNLTQLGTLILSYNKLSGMIPSTLGQMTSLSVLDLSRNMFTGPIPTSFASLVNLSVLDISGNFLFGLIPTGIGSLSKLQELNFSGNTLTGSVPSLFGNLSSLVELDLSFNLLVNPLPLDLNGMKNLQRVMLGNNKFSSELPGDLFKGLTGLEFVDLSNNNFSGGIPDELWSMSSLRYVDVSNNNFTGVLPRNTPTVNVSGAQFNLSNNMYYGGLTSVIQRFSFIDLSSNYFEGEAHEYAKSNASVRLNCLQNATAQRTTEDCTKFYASKGLAFDNFGHPNGTGAPIYVPTRKSHKRAIIFAAVFGGLGLLFILLLLLLLLFICTRRRGASRQRGNGVGPIPSAASPQSPTGMALNFASLGEAFTYQQLLQATGDFSDASLIKHGHSGDLFRGLLEGGIPVVIKRVDLNTVRREAYLLELDFFSKISHPRLVPLMGHCLDNENENEKFLVYKYMLNGDLSSSLYRKVKSEDGSLQSLDWITRLKIATGAAEGLAYLHHECTPPFVHRDVQASSILLDDKFEVRLGSLSDVCPQEGDTHQSMFTRFLRLPQTSEQGASGSQTSTCAYDVYCFGKVLLELVTGKMGISASNDASMKEWLDQTLPCINIYDKELINKVVDPSLIIDEDLLEEVWAMAIVAKSCLNPKPSRRPLMRYILRALENPLKVVRVESPGSGRLKTTSSRSSWNAAALFGSWRHGSDVGPSGSAPTGGSVSRAEGTSSMKLPSGTSESQGSGGAHNGGGGGSGSEYLASQRRQSREIFPEPFDSAPFDKSIGNSSFRNRHWNGFVGFCCCLLKKGL